MDRCKLEYEMARNKVSKAELADALGISRSALYRKMHGITEFTLPEIQKIVDILNLKNLDIFFRVKVA